MINSLWQSMVEKLRVKKIKIILQRTIFIKFLIKFYLFTSGIRPLGANLSVNNKINPINISLMCAVLLIQHLFYS